MCSSTCATKSRKINHRLILAVGQRSVSGICPSGMQRAAPSCHLGWDREWGTQRSVGQGWLSAPCFLGPFSYLVPAESHRVLPHPSSRPQSHSAEGGTGCANPAESLVCSTGVGHTLAFSRNKMEAGLPLILLPGLALGTHWRERGAFSSPLKIC